MPTVQLGRRTIAKLPAVVKPTIFYDAALKGFGLRLSPKGEARWLIEYRPGAGGRGVAKRRIVIGSIGKLNAEDAREKAKTMLASVQLGQDPAKDRSEARRGATVRELLAAYMDQHIRPKRKPGTAKYFDFIIENHLSPAFGTKRANDLTRHDVVKWHRLLGASGRAPTANRAVVVLAAAFEFGTYSGYFPENFHNPCKGIEKFRESRSERYLSESELRRLGDALRLAETSGIPWEPNPQKKVKHAPAAENRRVLVDPFAVAAIRLLLLTGARLREVLHLKWDFVDLQRGLLNLPDSKTGRKVIFLGTAAIDILAALPRVDDGIFVFPGSSNRIEMGESSKRLLATKPRSDLNKPWARIRAYAKLDGFRLHDLRHSFAAVGAGSGMGLPIVGRLLGHKEASTTARYAHLADDPLRRAINLISDSIASNMSDPGTQKTKTELYQIPSLQMKRGE